MHIHAMFYIYIYFVNFFSVPFLSFPAWFWSLISMLVFSLVLVVGLVLVIRFVSEFTHIVCLSTLFLRHFSLSSAREFSFGFTLGTAFIHVVDSDYYCVPRGSFNVRQSTETEHYHENGNIHMNTITHGSLYPQSQAAGRKEQGCVCSVG